MPTFGILEGNETVLWFSSREIDSYMSLIKFALSFARNIRDGRLDAICHTPFRIHEQEVNHSEEHRLLLKSKTFEDKRESITLHFCMDYPTSEIQDKSIAGSLLELFIEKFIDAMKVKRKVLDKIMADPTDFTAKCDEIFSETMMSYNLISEDAASFLVNAPQERSKKMDLLFSCISVQGLPVATMFYQDLSSHFRFTAMEEDEKDTILENLISAQLSTLLFQSLEKGTTCNYMLIRFSDFVSFTERNISINFFPIKSINSTETTPLTPDKFFFIVMSEGDPGLVKLFQSSISPLLAETGLLSEKFNGNVNRYRSLVKILEKFPRELHLD
ncbi:hypothetical protein GF325_09585 [Candidatus Bathyarchaeota archaeon]|nr:hypothetical protein [Candidatus Bathyarchaeota archaeon]